MPAEKLRVVLQTDSELSDLIRVHRCNERLARGEVAIERADADTGVLGQCAHRWIRRAVGEELPAALDQGFAVAIGIGRADVKEVDRLNIYWAAMEARRRAGFN